MGIDAYENGTTRARSIPYISLLLGLLTWIMHYSNLTERLALDLQNISFQSLFTSHWIHWSTEHLIWSGSAFVLLGMLCEKIARERFILLILVAAIAVSLGVIIHPEGIHTYAGLSGIDSALFGFALFVHINQSKKRGNIMAYRMAMVVGLGFIAKLGYELITGSAYFVSGTSDMVVVPVAHITGFIIGGLFAIGHRETSPKRDR